MTTAAIPSDLQPTLGLRGLRALAQLILDANSGPAHHFGPAAVTVDPTLHEGAREQQTARSG